MLLVEKEQSAFQERVYEEIVLGKVPKLKIVMKTIAQVVYVLSFTLEIFVNLFVYSRLIQI